MGGDDSQKLLPWRGILSPPGRKPPAQLRIQHCSGKLRGWGTCRHHLPRTTPGPVVAQLRTWVIFGKQTWVISPARRRLGAAFPAGGEIRIAACGAHLCLAARL